MSFIHTNLCVGQESHGRLCLPMSPLSLLSLCTERAEYRLASPALFFYASFFVERKGRHAHTHTYTQGQEKTDRQTVKSERQSVRRIDSQTDRFKHTRKHARTNMHTHMHTRTRIHIHIHAHTQTLTHTHVHIYIYVKHIRTHAHTHAQTHTQTHTHKHTHTNTHTHTHQAMSNKTLYCRKERWNVEKRLDMYTRELACRKQTWYVEKTTVRETCPLCYRLVY